MTDLSAFDATVQAIRRTGPTRVLIARDNAVPPSRAAIRHGIEPDVVFLRNDGWSLGAPFNLAHFAYATWSDDWVGFCLTADYVLHPMQSWPCRELVKDFPAFVGNIDDTIAEFICRQRDCIARLKSERDDACGERDSLRRLLHERANSVLSGTPQEQVETLTARVTELETELEEAIAKRYDEGYEAALRNYAWWKNGVQYVGCGVRTLEQALASLHGTDEEDES